MKLELNKELEKAERFQDAARETIAKSLVSFIPGGGLFNLLFDGIKQEQFMQRYEEWKFLIEERLTKLENKTDTEVIENKQFATALLTATPIMLKTAEIEKRKYLANGVVHSLDEDMDETTLIIFFNLLEKYTIWHFKMLLFFQNPLRHESALSIYQGLQSATLSPLQFFIKAYSAKAEQLDILRKIIKDLETDGLILEGGWATTGMTKQGLADKRTRTFGDRFIDFILLDGKC